MSLAISETDLETLRRRRARGERVSELARGLNVTWQLLDKALRHGLRPSNTVHVLPPTSPRPPITTPSPAHLPNPPAPHVVMHATRKVGPLTERYRPRSLEALLGQPRAREILTRFVQAPRPMAFLFEGETGTGKTSAAISLAAALGCAVEQEEFGGLWTIGSGDQTADTVRTAFERLWVSPMCGSGWKVLVVNEADRINRITETLWLDRLEGLPPRSVIVFSTNYAAQLSARLRDRCLTVSFEADARSLEADARGLAAGLYRAETGKDLDAATLDGIITRATSAGTLSFRRIVQAVEAKLLSE